jgi:iron complex outermembrane receptor protein
MTLTVKARLMVASTTALASMLANVSPAVAQAQTTAAPTQGKSGNDPVLEEIVVTADRANSYSADLVQAGSFRGARQLDTPLTISVIPNEVIQAQQAQGLLDALRNTAGVTSAQTSPTVYSNVAIRGINVENRGNYRLDGSLPIVNLIDLPLEDKDRVEALKGASALYYGFTTPSGIINLTMKRPTVEPYVAAKVFGNGYGALGGHLDVGGTKGIFGARVNAVYGSVDPGIDNTRGHRSLLAGAFDIKPTDSVTIKVDAEHILKEVNEPGVYRFTTPPQPTLTNLYPKIPLPPVLDPKTNFGPDWASNRAEETNLLGTVDWKLSPAWVASISAGTSRVVRDRHFNTLNPTNYVTGEGTLTISLQPGSTFKNTNTRAELAGTFNTGFLTHELLVGASQNVRDAFNSTNVNVTCPGATPTSPRVPCTQNFYNPRPIPETAFPVRTGGRTRIDDVGYYLFDRVKVTNWLQVLGGVRKSDYTESNLDTDTDTFADKPTSLSGGVVIKPKSWLSVYGTYIEGLETSPGAPGTAVNAGAQLPAATSKQYEGGIKFEPIRSLLGQVAYFHIDRASNFVNAANVYVQDGRAIYKGEEISLTGEIMKDWSVFLSGLFLDATQESGQPTTIVTNRNGSVTITPTANGLEIENTAKRQYSLFDVGMSYATDVFGNEMLFQINGENIGGKQYFASTGASIIAQGGPRMIKFAVSTKF